MDDFNDRVLLASRDEWVAQLLMATMPHFVQGIRSIFDEAAKTCAQNGDPSRVLVIFQTFLTRVPAWNEHMIQQETERIIEASRCTYLEELLLCANVATLKLLTAARAGQQPRRVDLQLPKLHTFVHQVYIAFARKAYLCAYLFNPTSPPLEMQAHRRALEGLAQESILATIRRAMPVEQVLRQFLDEAQEDFEELLPASGSSLPGGGGGGGGAPPSAPAQSAADDAASDDAALVVRAFDPGAHDAPLSNDAPDNDPFAFPADLSPPLPAAHDAAPLGNDAHAALLGDPFPDATRLAHEEAWADDLRTPAPQPGGGVQFDSVDHVQLADGRVEDVRVDRSSDAVSDLAQLRHDQRQHNLSANCEERGVEGLLVPAAQAQPHAQAQALAAFAADDPFGDLLAPDGGPAAATTAAPPADVPALLTLEVEDL